MFRISCKLFLVMRLLTVINQRKNFPSSAMKPIASAIKKALGKSLYAKSLYSSTGKYFVKI